MHPKYITIFSILCFLLSCETRIEANSNTQEDSQKKSLQKKIYDQRTADIEKEEDKANAIRIEEEILVSLRNEFAEIEKREMEKLTESKEMLGAVNIELIPPPPSAPVVIPATVPAPVLTASKELDRSVIKKIMRRNLTRIKYCYEKELIKNPSLAGKLTVSFQIETSGSVKNVKRIDTGVSSVVNACVIKTVDSLKFPAFPKGKTMTITYPFIFKT